eukprot:CAMPEP_0113454350 /NCGR_PEP_ID=MMETSP0014_2-20120614/7818_1 /TAXON_ID=2857 /ORGANISM="Nitzschia sp." /LENGTH=450 /DNA_ID=CAMNT_0000345753 /DNA_START=269 /DNA_END=1621 /DNA_ORIENTATION=+ /assembly_acc=CAM_ASM_000159
MTTKGMVVVFLLTIMMVSRPLGYVKIQQLQPPSMTDAFLFQPHISRHHDHRYRHSHTRPHHRRHHHHHHHHHPQRRQRQRSSSCHVPLNVSSESNNNNSSSNESNTANNKKGKVWEGEENKDPNLLKLAELSLKDYEWRKSYFEQQEADRKVEESVARLMGDEPSYVRPMDAGETKIGPLGTWEKTSVEWLRRVIEEEGQRAKEIVKLGGILVRPIDAAKEAGVSPGPLASLEQRVVDFFEQIRVSERERSRLKVVRPKNMDDDLRGPLGEAERRASEAIREILQSELTRAQQSRLRDGIVRPIDVPGPLGEFELRVLEIVRAEEARAAESKTDPNKLGKFGTIRPMNAKQKGPLGEMEERAIEAVNRLTSEEKERLRNIQKYLAETRPMEQDRNSLLGIVETVVVGVVRAPILVFQIASRVKYLLQSEPLQDEDSELLDKASRKEEPRA